MATVLFRLAVRDQFRVIPKVLSEHHQFSASPRHINEPIAVNVNWTIADGHGGWVQSGNVGFRLKEYLRWKQ